MCNVEYDHVMKENLYSQIDAIIDKSLPLVSNLSNVSSILNKMEDINWCGFYLVDKDTLYLGPFQGEVACTKIPEGKGVCGTSFLEKKTVIVDDVTIHPNHIACSSLSRSEIVTPIIKDGEVKGVIDIDSPITSRFTSEDKIFLEKVASLLSKLF